MNRIWRKFRILGKKKKLEITVAFGLIIIAACVTFLNFVGFITVSSNALLEIIIVLLCSSFGVSLLQELDTLDDISRNVNKISSKINVVESEFRTIGKRATNSLTTKGIILPRKKIDEKINLNDIWQDATEICFLAIANTSHLRGNGIVKIKEAVKRGTKINILSLDPESTLVNEYEKSGIVSDTSLPLSGNIIAYAKQCRKSEGFKDAVTLKTTNCLLPYSMMIVKKEREVTFLKVDLYGVCMDYMDRRSFVVPNDDRENIEFYLKQWDSVWNNIEATTVVSYKGISNAETLTQNKDRK